MSFFDFGIKIGIKIYQVIIINSICQIFFRKVIPNSLGYPSSSKIPWLTIRKRVAIKDLMNNWVLKYNVEKILLLLQGIWRASYDMRSIHTHYLQRFSQGIPSWSPSRTEHPQVLSWKYASAHVAIRVHAFEQLHVYCAEGWFRTFFRLTASTGDAITRILMMQRVRARNFFIDNYTKLCCFNFCTALSKK